MFDSLRLWYQNDPRSRVKLLFIIGVTIVLSLFVTLIVLINLPQENSARENTSRSIDTETVSDAQSLDESNRSAQKIEKVYDYQISSTHLIDISQDSVITTDILGTVYRNGVSIDQNFAISPVSIYQFNASLLINGDNGVYFQSQGMVSVSQLDESILYAYPSTQYVYTLETTSEEGVLVIKRYNGIPGQGGGFGLLVARGEFGSNTSLKELYVFDSTIVLLEWSSTIRRELLTLHTVAGTRIEGVGSIEGVEDLKMYDNGMLLKTRLSPQLQWYNFKGDVPIRTVIENAQNSSINSFLNTQDINSDLLPSRCDFKDSNTLFCLVKEDITKQVNDIFSPDIIVEINLENGEVSTSYDSLLLSARSLHWNESENTHYIVNQLESKLYKIVKS